MNAFTVKAIVHNGRVETEAPLDWPDGTEVRIELSREEEAIGMRDEDWPSNPEGINTLLELMDQTPSLRMTPEEEAAWQTAREAQKEHEKSRFFEHAEKLRKAWE